jgi:hypothetical protein
VMAFGEGNEVDMIDLLIDRSMTGSDGSVSLFVNRTLTPLTDLCITGQIVSSFQLPPPPCVRIAWIDIDGRRLQAS